VTSFAVPVWLFSNFLPPKQNSPLLSVYSLHRNASNLPFLLKLHKIWSVVSQENH